MATLTNLSPGLSFVSTGSSAAAAATTVTLPVAPSGYATVIDTIAASYVGTVQTSQVILVRVAGGGTTRWQTDYLGAVAGLANWDWVFPGGMKGIDGEDWEVFGAAMANCAQKISVTGHFELADRTA